MGMELENGPFRQRRIGTGKTMSGSNHLADRLGPLARIFERHVVWAVRAVLESDVEIKEPFHVTDAPPGGHTLFCLIPNSNGEFHAQLAVGLAKEDLPRFFPGEVDPRLRLDALGEMSNVVAGLLMSDEDFMGKFGHLKPSTPFFSEGAFTGRSDSGLRGSVLVDGKAISFHITVRPAGRETWHGETPRP
jgi:hypothetical protein